mmetsp:Transcript_127155/g.317552  ORF Transcript_127155/g.317552 Transcript_127155/m.317552 type:complete len:890 (-) Transcript_127155:390-3059(-)
MATRTADPSNIKVCIRVRPFAAREQGETCIVDMPTKEQVLINSAGGGVNDSRNFKFDRAFSSHCSADPLYASQETLMEELGNDVLENAFDGFNNCLFAYGQTGSGKTHSMLGGEGDQRGLLPRILEGLFQRIAAQDKGSVSFQCKISYLEIYNENIRDLLVPLDERSKTKLEVHHHPKLGVYVPGLSEVAVTTLDEVRKLLDFGQKSRVVAATNMNATSSRSHCIFIFFLEKESQTITGSTETKETLRSCVNLVDLAGSERQAKTKAEGARLKEGAMINKSLSNLAAVISKLSAASQSPSANDHVPFRNSKLTHLLQESLSGNSKTVMVAAISPAKSNLDETLSTLRFAQTCKSVKTRAARNQESTQSIVEALKAEIEQLRAAAKEGGHNPEVAKQIEENERLRRKLEDKSQTLQQWEEKRRRALEDMGLSVYEITDAMGMDPNTPQLINVSEDPSLSGNLVYYLTPGADTTLGADKACKIVLAGLGMKPFMCSLKQESMRRVTLTLLGFDGKPLSTSGLAQLAKPQSYHGHKTPGRVLVNGRVPKALRQDLHHTDRIIVGHAYCFRLVMPLVAAESPPVSPVEGVLSVNDDIDEALCQIIHDHADEFTECRALMESMQDKLGPKRAKEFLELFGRTLPLVEEGNLITSAMRPKDCMRFQLELRRDIMTLTTTEPDLIVCLYKGTGRDGEEVVIDVSELPQFMDKLSLIRDMYAEFQAHPGSFDSSRSGQDPWMLCSHRDLQEAALEAKHTLDEEIRRRERAELKIAMLERQLSNARGFGGIATATGGSQACEQDVDAQAGHDPLCAARAATKLLGNLQQLQLDIRGYAQQLQDEPVIQSPYEGANQNGVSNGDVKLPVEMRIAGPPPPTLTLPLASRHGSPEVGGGYF